MTTPRDVAARVLARVDEDRSFASAALQAELSRAVQLEPRDRALATEIVYGSLRVLPWLVARIEAHARQENRQPKVSEKPVGGGGHIGSPHAVVVSAVDSLPVAASSERILIPVQKLPNASHA